MANSKHPLVGFTSSDLAKLRSIYPRGERHRGPAADVFAVPGQDQGTPWLIVSRQKDGAYVSIDPLKGTRIARRSLADLSLE